MENPALKDKIHQLIDTCDNEMLEVVYQLLQPTEYTDEFKNVLNEELADYQKNKKGISKEEMDLLIKEVLRNQ